MELDPVKIGIKGPLKFGDTYQIRLIRWHELKAEYDRLPACQECRGMADCSKCGRECGSCDGSGKDWKAQDQFLSAHPGFSQHRKPEPTDKESV
jgi:hypothetical protein